MLAERLEQFRNRLLDMSRRNRLLNFKAKGNRSVRLSGQTPDGLYQWLVNENKPVDFLTLDDARTSEGGSNPARHPIADEQSSPSHSRRSDSDVPVKQIMSPPHRAGDATIGKSALRPSPASNEPSSIGEEPVAEPGKTFLDLPEDKLDSRLLLLAREAESAMQEQSCNILYVAFGLLDWVDPNEHGGKPSAAPMVLVPVELARRDANQRYRLQAIEDEPVVNPTLIELCQRNYRLDLPELDPESATPLDDFFAAVEELVAGPRFKDWRVRREIHLGLFSFAKLLMYLDLSPARWPEGQSIGEHPLVTRLCGTATAGDEGADGNIQNESKIDDELHPRDCFQVVDADSSQQVAILTAKRGTSMVIEGPPGTGKSQTITNIIAECIGAGKSVLFVAEKAAALEVVKRNLDRVGLGEFALAMHSRQANKRAILDELDRALRFEYAGPLPHEGDADELFRLRNRLNEYVHRLHERIAPLGISRFEAMAICSKLRMAHEAPFTLHDIAAWDKQRLADVQEHVESFARALSRVGNAALHPWRGVGLVEATLTVRQQLPIVLSSLIEATSDAQKYGRELAEYLGASAPTCRQQAQGLIDVVKAILEARTLNSESASRAVSEDSRADMQGLLNCGRHVTALRDELGARWKLSAEGTDWSAVAERRRRQSGSVLRWLRPLWYRDTAVIRQHLAIGTDPRGALLVDDLDKLVELQGELAELRRLSPRGRELFGAIWHEDGEKWSAVETHARAVEVVRQLVAHGQTTRDAVLQACGDPGRRELSRLAKSFATACNDMFSGRKQLKDLLRLDVDTFLGCEPESMTFDRWQERLKLCQAAIDGLNDWTDRARRDAACRKHGLGAFVDWCNARAGELTADEYAEAFQRQFYRLWLETATESWADFRLQRGDDLEGLIARFCEADRRWLSASRARLIAVADARRPQKGQAASKTSRLGLLEAEVRKKRNIKPIRKLFAQLGDVVVALKPCFMMSPMSAAQYLEPGKLSFDVVIFDEASQVEPADALGAIARGRQVILVGDEKQLPPTNFFGVVNDADDVDEAAEDDDLPSTQDLESVLAMGQVCLRAKTSLRWHYRSRHNSLIEFSNEAFYDRQLRVFPSPERGRETLGLAFRHISDGVYFRGKGQYNAIEARAVAEAVIEHARQTPDVSLGVGAFSMAQQRAIGDEIESLRRSQGNASLEAFFNPGAESPFFVKNLETIQGDERDVIFLSVGYGPDENKRLTANFGPLNRDGGWRRLNVLITRARVRCVVFCSFTADQLELKPDSPRGVCALKDYLHFAEHGSLPSIRQYTDDHDSPFEADVCSELRQHGWTVHAQVGCAGFSVDLAVVDPKLPGRYLLGIECDGATYHSSATARDRDRLRQDVLENLKWRIYRIWSTDWFDRRAETLDRLLRHVKDIANLPTNAKSDLLQTDVRGMPPIPGATALPDSSGFSSAKAQAAATEDPPSQSETEDRSAGSSLPGMVPYRRYPAWESGTSDQLLALYAPDVVALMTEVVTTEGPIHVEELFRRVAHVYRARVTGQVKSKLAIALDTGNAVRRFEVRGKFVWPPGIEQPPVRWRGNDDAVTSAELICPDEVAQAAVLLLQHDFGIPLDDLPAATLRAMGFKRVGPQLAALANLAIQQAVASQRIRPDPAGFMIAATT